MPVVAVLDASAVTAFLLREKGSDAVRRIIDAGAVVTATGLGETLATCRRRGHPRTRDELVQDLDAYGLGVEPVTAEDGVEIAFLLDQSDRMRETVEAGQNSGRGSLSLGDAACLAVAKRLELPAVMSDGTWEVIDLGGIKVLPFR